jgi:hypothetical protein
MSPPTQCGTQAHKRKIHTSKMLFRSCISWSFRNRSTCSVAVSFSFIAAISALSSIFSFRRVAGLASDPDGIKQNEPERSEPGPFEVSFQFPPHFG